MGNMKMHKTKPISKSCQTPMAPKKFNIIFVDLSQLQMINNVTQACSDMFNRANTINTIIFVLSGIIIF